MSFLDDITSVVLGAAGIIDSVDKTIQDGETVVLNIRAEAKAIKNFTVDPKWRTRVINAPRAVEQTKTLISDVTTQIENAFHSFTSNLKGIKGTARSGQISPSGQKSGISSILGILSEIKLVIGEIDELFVSLNDFVESLRQITVELETFDTLFLPQGSSKTTVEVKYRKRNA